MMDWTDRIPVLSPSAEPNGLALYGDVTRVAIVYGDKALSWISSRWSILWCCSRGSDPRTSRRVSLGRRWGYDSINLLRCERPVQSGRSGLPDGILTCPELVKAWWRGEGTPVP